MIILIREAVENDVEGIARVHVQGWRESYKDFLSPEALGGFVRRGADADVAGRLHAAESAGKASCR
jgi:hypothetical protein